MRGLWGRRSLTFLATITAALVIGSYFFRGDPTTQWDMAIPSVPISEPTGPDLLPPPIEVEEAVQTEAREQGGSVGSQGPEPEDAEVEAVLMPTEPTRLPPGPGEMLKPVDGKVLAGYGWGYSLTMGDYRMHNGIDFATPEQGQVRAAASGRVAAVKRDKQWDATVIIDHGGDLTTHYAGLRSVLVSVGRDVKAGEAIGVAGTGGMAEVGLGPHVHFEVSLGGRATDPTDYLK